MEFARLTDPYRRELFVHCYRMLGSSHEAEDLVQETYLRAWRAFEKFEGRSSLRVWLYKIATMACLTALDGRSRAALPSGLAPPSADHRLPLIPALPGHAWVEPAPDARLLSGDPAEVVVERTRVRLAFVTALQQLSARQRAVLILRDVLEMRAAETAEALGTTPTAVNSTLRRARAQLAAVTTDADGVGEPSDAAERAVLDAFAAAWERADVKALVALLRKDVELEMPPVQTWFKGRDTVAAFLAEEVVGHPGSWRLLPIRANAQPALVTYRKTGDGTYGAHGVHVLRITGDQVSRIIAFNDPSLVPLFGHPVVLDGPAGG
jgi:RNA polymerase sigma-70 factor (ECF subfamily)